MNKLRLLGYKIIYQLAKFYWKIFRPRTSGARGIILYDQEILLVKNLGSKHWLLPGGGFKKNEDEQQCLFRELEEELKKWEIEDAGWFQLSALPSKTSPATLRRIQEFQNGNKNLVSIW
jgi:hypothetical protein